MEGRVAIDVSRGEAPAARVSFTQPGDVARVLAGKTPSAALAIIPALFSLCGKAQAQAAHLALDAAQGRTPEPETLVVLQCLTEMESLRENALRIALDWSCSLGEKTDAAASRPLMRLLPELEAILIREDDANSRCERAHAVIKRAEELMSTLVFGEPVDVWRERSDAQAVADWARQGHTPSARLLHHIASRGQADAGAVIVHRLRALDDRDLRAWLLGASNCLPVVGMAQVPETTLLARHVRDPRLSVTESDGAGIWARLTARLIELSELPERMRALVEGTLAPDAGRSLGDEAGAGVVAAARGTLIHAVTLERGRIASYRVLPPTRWNFDAHGIAARAIASIAAKHSGDTENLAHMMISAIDPCVAFSVRMH